MNESHWDKPQPQELADYISELRRLRYRVLCQNSTPVPDARYDLLLTLILNPNRRFTSRQLATHSVGCPIAETEVDELLGVLLSNPPLLGTPFQIEWVRAFREDRPQQGSPQDTLKVYVFREDHRPEVDWKGKDPLRGVFSACEAIPPESLFPKGVPPKFDGYVWYYDSTSQRRETIEFDPESPLVPIASGYHRFAYFQPFPMELIASTQSHGSEALAPYGGVDVARHEETYLTAKFQPGVKTMFLKPAFSQLDVEIAEANKITLLTPFDLLRFQTPPEDHQLFPTLAEWNDLCSTPGLASLEVIRIVRNRGQEFHAPIQ